MTSLRYQIVIDRPLPDVYAFAADIERHPQFIPDYLTCRVLDRQEQRWLVERTALIHGKLQTWQAWVRFEENHALHFLHRGGRIDGMRVTWRFVALDQQRTQMVISQDFDVHFRFPFAWLAGWLEKRVFAPKLRNIGDRVIRHFKAACEKHTPITA